MPLRTVPLDGLIIEDERSYRHVGLYDGLKQALRRDDYRFRVPAPGTAASWDRVAFLNLTFWDPAEQGDVLVSDHLPADVVMHAAWHHLARRALGTETGTGTKPRDPAGAGPSAASTDALLLGESIASAFDVYLVGRLLGHAPDAQFLDTQVPAMAEVAEAAGMPEAAFEALLSSIAEAPERAFEDLRALLFDVLTALAPARGVEEAEALLRRFEGRRFHPLLHHFELSNWLLYARAYGRDGREPDPRVREVDAALRGAPVSLDWLEERWLGAAFGA